MEQSLSSLTLRNPLRAGIGLRGGHHAAIQDERPSLGFLEVHAENYMGGGAGPAALERLRVDYPVSIHGVGLSLAGADGPAQSHLYRLRRLIERFEPFLVSEHLAWSGNRQAYLNDLLPIPYTEEALEVVAGHVTMVQERLRPDREPVIPDVDGRPKIAQLVAYNLTEVTVRGSWSGPARLHLVPHVNAPVADLPVRQILGGRHFIADLTLLAGRVLLDYLTGFEAPTAAA